MLTFTVMSVVVCRMLVKSQIMLNIKLYLVN